MAELVADFKKLSLQSQALHVRQALRAQFARNPQLVNEYVVRAARQTRAALFPRLENHYADRSVDYMVSYTQFLLSMWMKTSAPHLDALRNNIYFIMQEIVKHDDWPWTLHDTYDFDGPVFPEFLHVVAQVAHGLPPLDL